MKPFLAARLAKWKQPLLSFAVGQPAVQLLNLLTGFLLLRWLSKEEFAMFGVAFAFQVTIGQLADLGFGGSVVALAGERGAEPAWLGRYLRAARHYRARLLGFTLMGAAVAFPLLTWQQEWGAGSKLLLIGAVAAGVGFQSWTVYGAPLLVHRRLRDYYSPQITGAAVRLALCAGLHFTGLLSAWVVAWLGALVVGYTGWSYRRAAREYAHEPAESDPEANREMRRYLAPMMPGAAFTALQGQITVALITIYGATDKIAEVSALGRIGQLFLVLNAFSAVIIEPYFARLPVQLLHRRYGQIVCGASILALVICAAGFMFPAPLLWLLGPKYTGLERETSWMVASACAYYIYCVFLALHRARRWVFWWNTIIYMITMLTVQVVCAIFIDLSHTMGVVYFGFISTVVLLVVNASNGVYGFWRLRSDAKNPHRA